jgi:hypothetical protein
MDCSTGQALVFEGEEAMIAAISEDPLSFKVFLIYYGVYAYGQWLLSRDSRLMFE